MKSLSDTDQYKCFQPGEPNGNMRTVQVQKEVLNYKPRLTLSITGTGAILVIVSNTLFPHTSLLVRPNNLPVGEVHFRPWKFLNALQDKKNNKSTRLLVFSTDSSARTYVLYVDANDKKAEKF